MTLPNEVKFKVRAIALDLETFTVAQMTRVTTLNPTSIRTELQRMKREGYLTSEPIREGKSGRGAPPHRFQLTDAPEKRLALARSIEPFFSPPPTPAPRPLSLHYQAAVTLTERLESGELSETERETTLRDAHHHLALAVEEEGVDIRPETETAVAAAYLDLLRARLAIATSQWKQAEALLQASLQTFTEHRLGEMVTQAESLRTALKVEQTLARAPADPSLPDRLLTVLETASGALPVFTVRRMLGVLRTLTASGWQAQAIQSLSRTLEMIAAQNFAVASARVVQAELRQEAEEIAQKEPAHALTSERIQQRDVSISAPDDLFRPRASSQRGG
jgi:DNA-binding PadR family transcriptional regulator